MTGINLIVVLLAVGIPLSAVASWGFAWGMRRARWGQAIRSEGPDTHHRKAGTPTMGGAVFLILWAAMMGLMEWKGMATRSGWFVLSTGMGFGLVGLADDVLSVRRGRSLGLAAWHKVAISTAVAAALLFAFSSEIETVQQLPWSSGTVRVSGAAALLLAWFVLLSTTNAMNLTDGLDGLATGVTIIVMSGCLILCKPSVAWQILPLLGLLAGFLWVNGYPSRLFMGDVGSFALGGTIGALAITSGTVFLLPLLAGVLVLEAGSVILQVGSWKLSGRRCFKMSPLHHHFERLDRVEHDDLLPDARWSEPKIVLRFWGVQLACTSIGVWAAYGVS